jgi:hypothetical protein
LVCHINIIYLLMCHLNNSAIATLTVKLLCEFKAMNWQNMV